MRKKIFGSGNWTKAETERNAGFVVDCLLTSLACLKGRLTEMKQSCINATRCSGQLLSICNAPVGSFVYFRYSDGKKIRVKLLRVVNIKPDVWSQ